ncbi:MULTISPECIES: Fic family protein [unclassified Nocardioides]|uniref:Fic family protein n=1 Tax=unclassified Nocardioides TaxID=2615069 RepID=UPI0012FC1E04|nr:MULTISPECIES: Fic family protein [unclassified Nocardioides]
MFPPPLQAEAEDAVRAITRFDADIASVELAPLAAVLLRTESASSSQIEGVTAGARALALAAIEKRSGRNAELVVANVTAMQRGIELADDISVGSILAVHDALLHGHEYAAPGRFRTEQVWIGSTAISPHAASFVPPHHDRVPAAMDDLIDFVRRTDLPVLVHVAIAHAQFETIHPFNDGNGRVGRTLVHAMLRHADVTRHLTVPVSAGLLADTSAYFDALTAYRAGDVEPIVRQFIAASFRAVDNGRILIEDLDRILQSWTDKLPSRRGSAARRLLPLLVNQPAVNVAYAVETTGVALSAAQRAVEQLEEAGILVRAGAARRNRVWTAPDVIDALDRFAERAGRRS